MGGQVGRGSTRVQARVPGAPGRGAPGTQQRQAEREHRASAGRRVADERADQDQRGHEVGRLRGRPCRDTGAHGVPHEHRRSAAQLGQQRDHVGARGDVVVFGEGSVALAMASEVHRGDAIPGSDQCRLQEPVDGAEVAHPGNTHHEGTLPRDVVRDPASWAIQEPGGVLNPGRDLGQLDLLHVIS